MGAGTLHPREGDAEGSGGSAATQGDHGLPEDGPRLVRLQLGHHPQVYLLVVLPTGRPPEGKSGLLVKFSKVSR